MTNNNIYIFTVSSHKGELTLTGFLLYNRNKKCRYIFLFIFGYNESLQKLQLGQAVSDATLK